MSLDCAATWALPARCLLATSIVISNSYSFGSSNGEEASRAHLSHPCHDYSGYSPQFLVPMKALDGTCRCLRYLREAPRRCSSICLPGVFNIFFFLVVVRPHRQLRTHTHLATQVRRSLHQFHSATTEADTACFCPCTVGSMEAGLSCAA